SSTEVQRAITAGRRSAIAFHTARAWSYSGSPGPMTWPAKPGPRSRVTTARQLSRRPEALVCRDYPRCWSPETRVSRDYPRCWSPETLVSRDYLRCWSPETIVSRDYQASLAAIATGRESARYFVSVPSPIAAWAAARRATGTLNGLHDT